MRFIYLDASHGVSGDMFLAALLDLGADETALRDTLSTLPCHDEFALHVSPLARHGLHGKQIEVQETHPHHHHHHAHGDEEAHSHGHAHEHGARKGYSEFAALIQASGMQSAAKQRAIHVLRCLAEAEAKVHHTSIEEVHFHEVGGIDTIVDICGVVIALELLGVERIFVSPINMGGGSIQIAHGLMSVPPPAVAELLQGLPVHGDSADKGELTTPTGAALLKGLQADSTPLPAGRFLRQGCGMGQRDNGTPNALRIQLGETLPATPGQPPTKPEDSAALWMLECNIDDMDGEELAYAMDRLRETAALEVYLTPILMKKGRPAYLLSVLAPAAEVEVIENRILFHTTTLGVRRMSCLRTTLERHMLTVDTEYGLIRVKCVQQNGQMLRYKAEFDDCSAAAQRFGVPLNTVIQTVDAVMSNRKPVS